MWLWTSLTFSIWQALTVLDPSGKMLRAEEAALCVSPLCWVWMGDPRLISEELPWVEQRKGKGVLEKVLGWGF